jgi:hypothetical protein
MRVRAVGLETVREDASVRLYPHDLSGSKLEAEKVKADVGEVAAPVHNLAVDDLRLLGMQHQLAGREAVSNRTPECPRLFGALAMTDDVVRGPTRRIDIRRGSRREAGRRGADTRKASLRGAGPCEPTGSVAGAARPDEREADDE